MSEGYTVKEMLSQMESRIDERFKQVIALQEKTNGRVRALEMWRSALVGGMSIITILGLPNVLQVLANSI